MYTQCTKKARVYQKVVDYFNVQIRYCISLSIISSVFISYSIKRIDIGSLSIDTYGVRRITIN